MRLFRATPEATKFQRTGVAKTDRKTMPQQDPTRPEQTDEKTPFLKPKWFILGAKSRPTNDMEAKSARTHVSGPTKSLPERSWRASEAQEKHFVLHG